MHLAALRIEPRKHVLDDAVFARRVQSLQDGENRPASLRVEPLLQLGEPLDRGREQLFRLRLVDVEAARVFGVAMGELEAGLFVDAKARDRVGGKHGLAAPKAGMARAVPECPAPRVSNR